MDESTATAVEPQTRRVSRSWTADPRTAWPMWVGFALLGVGAVNVVVGSGSGAVISGVSAMVIFLCVLAISLLSASRELDPYWVAREIGERYGLVVETSHIDLLPTEEGDDNEVVAYDNGRAVVVRVEIVNSQPVVFTLAREAERRAL